MVHKAFLGIAVNQAIQVFRDIAEFLDKMGFWVEVVIAVTQALVATQVFLALGLVAILVFLEWVILDILDILALVE